jgi:hypothetical protein
MSEIVDPLLLCIRCCNDTSYLHALREVANRNIPGHIAIRQAVDARIASLRCISRRNRPSCDARKCWLSPHRRKFKRPSS